MKKIIATLLLMYLTLLIFPLGAQASFPRSREYSDGTFQDIGGWSRESIITCYELGLMNGMGEGEFQPAGDVSLAQVVTVAVRLADLYAGGDGNLPGSGAIWYDAAVNKAAELQIISPGEFDSYERPASRSEVARLLTRALPGSVFSAINEVSELPDVKPWTQDSDAILALYRSGILSGSDDYGTYSPDANLTREAFAAILTRVCIPDYRMTLSLLPVPEDLTVLTSSLTADFSGYTCWGLVTINGEYYMPMDALSACEGMGGVISSDSDSGDNPTLKVKDARHTVALAETAFAQDGIFVGVAQPAPSYSMQTVDGEKRIRHMAIGGLFHMINLSDLADGQLTVSDGVLHVPLDGVAVPEVRIEADLVGQALGGLMRDTPADTVLAIHDYIVYTLSYGPPSRYDDANNLVYDYDGQANLALAQKKGVCEHYARLFQEMCLRAGIPCKYVHGCATPSSGMPGHAWNRVYLNGQWSYVDCTWDDPIGGYPNYSYYLKTTEEMAVRHSWMDEDYPTPTTYDPAWEQLDPNNLTDANMYRECVAAQIKQKKTDFTLHAVVPEAFGGYANLLLGGYSFVYLEELSQGNGYYTYHVDYWWTDRVQPPGC